MLNSFYDKFIFTNGLKYKHNNFFLIHLPFVIAPTAVLTGLMSSNDLEFNKKLYYNVKSSVKTSLVKQFHLDFGFKGDKIVNFLETYFVASGWGKIQTVDLDFEGKKAIVKVSDNPFSKKLHGKVKEPCDHILRGIFAGLFSYAFGENVDCVEVHCSVSGEQDCEFIVKKPGDFNIEKKNVRDQLELDI